jgi:hypothetical protein
VKYPSPITCHSKVRAKVKVSDRMIDRTKTICPPIFDHGGIKTNKRLMSHIAHLSIWQPISRNQFSIEKFKYKTDPNLPPRGHDLNKLESTPRSIMLH